MTGEIMNTEHNLKKGELFLFDNKENTSYVVLVTQVDKTTTFSGIILAGKGDLPFPWE
jgi:hypothetical protein